MIADDFATAVGRLLNQVGHWEESRWSTTGASGATRADVVHTLVQRLADLAADAEGRARRPVPHSAGLLLPDQLRVMSDDLLTADPPATLLAPATEAVNSARKNL